MNITVEFSSDSLWGSTDPAEYDSQQSEANFATAVENHLYDRYSDAEIEVKHSINDRILVDGVTDGEEIPWIEQIIEQVYNGDDWLVHNDDD